VLITYRGLTTLNSWHETGLVKDQFSKQTLLSVLLLLHSNHHFSSVLGLSVCWAQINLMERTPEIVSVTMWLLLSDFSILDAKTHLALLSKMFYSSFYVFDFCSSPRIIRFLIQ
jgi:hypothetical protein